MRIFLSKSGTIQYETSARRIVGSHRACFGRQTPSPCAAEDDGQNMLFLPLPFRLNPDLTLDLLALSEVGSVSRQPSIRADSQSESDTSCRFRSRRQPTKREDHPSDERCRNGQSGGGTVAPQVPWFTDQYMDHLVSGFATIASFQAFLQLTVSYRDRDGLPSLTTRGRADQQLPIFLLRSLGLHPMVDISPQSVQQFPRQRYDSDLPHSRAARTKAFLVPLRQSTSRLQPQPDPCHLDDDATDVTVASLANPLFLMSPATGMRCRRQTHQGPKFFPIANLSPAEYLGHEQPRAAHSDPLETHQASCLLKPRLRAMTESATLNIANVLNLAVKQLPECDFLENSLTQSLRNRLIIPIPQRIQLFTKVNIHRCGDSHGGQKALDPIAASCLLMLQIFQTPMQLPPIFVVTAWNIHNRPHLLTRMMSHQQAQQFPRIQSIRFGLSRSTVFSALNRCGIDDEIDQSMMCQTSMQPEAIPSGFIARMHWALRRKIEPRLRLDQLLDQHSDVAGGNRATPRILTRLRRTRDQPLVQSQVEGHVQTSSFSIRAHDAPMGKRCETTDFVSGICFRVATSMASDDGSHTYRNGR